MIEIIYQADCLDVLKSQEDKSIDLIIADPPYGLNIVKKGKVGGAGKNFIGKMVSPRAYKGGEWDNAIPSKEYFDEMLRVGKKVVIFGGNYFNEYLPQGNKWVVWDKKATGNFSKCELIWTSEKGRIEKFDWEWNGFIQGNGRGGRQRIKRVHPSQKPVELIEYLIKMFSKEGDLILDPFAGSGTVAVACVKLKREFVLVEKDTEYVDIIKERLNSMTNLSALLPPKMRYD